MNNLTGDIPPDLDLLSYLAFINASFNNFLGPITQQGFFNSNRINGSSFLGNPGLCGPIAIIGSPHQECTAIPLTVSTQHGHCKDFNCKSLWIQVAAVASAVVLLGVICTTVGIKLGWIFYRRGNNDNNFKTQLLLNFGALKLTEKDVLRTIDDPSSDNIIGTGARSIVYKRVLPGGQTFALKKLLTDSHVQNTESSFQDDQHNRLVREAEILAKIRHKNILKFLSYYSSLDHKALIVEYMREGSLHKHLHEVEPCKLTWQRRLNIALSVAEGMKYRHHDLGANNSCGFETEQHFFGCGLATKVGDFGLSKFVGAQGDGKATASTFCGTIGYMPPEYGTQIWVSTKGDVYSYGMIVLERLTRRQPCSTAALEDQGTDLRNWVLKYFQKRPCEVLDPCLVIDGSLDELFKDRLMYLLRVSLF